MIGRLELIAGFGTAARFADICVWAGPEASESLLTFLIDSARNVGPAPKGGTRLADHIGQVLAGGDPEPGVAFAAVGPGSDAGTELILHGAVQAWDGRQWIVPQPRPGWLRTRVPPGSTLIVTAHGVAPPAPARGSDLRSGVVPAAGLALRLDVGSEPEPAPSAALPGQTTVLGSTELAQALGRTPDGPPPAAEVPTAVTAIPGAEAPHPEPFAFEPPDGPPPEPPFGLEPDGGVIPYPGLEPPEHEAEPGGPDLLAPPEAAPAPDLPPRPPGVIDLPAPGGRRSAPLAPVGAPEPPVTGAVVVAGVRCPRAHFNHPAVQACVTCGLPVDAGQGRVSGPRPSLGVLIGDDGAVTRLDASYLVGSGPGADPSVTGGRARPLVLAGAPDVATAHAEVRLTAWAVSVVDRGAPRATLLLAPGALDWVTLAPYVDQVLTPGSHIGIGDRTLSFISPWPSSQPES